MMQSENDIRVRELEDMIALQNDTITTQNKTIALLTEMLSEKDHRLAENFVQLDLFPELAYDDHDLDNAADNIRVYVPLDLNRTAILRRLRYIIQKYGEAGEDNEINFSIDVEKIISQIEVYDQLWSARTNHPEAGDTGKSHGHSEQAVELVKTVIEVLEDIPDAGAEMFPFDVIEELKEEYMITVL